MSLFSELATRQTYTLNATPSGTVFNLTDLLPGGFVITDLVVDHGALGTGVTLAIREETQNEMGTGFAAPTNLIAATGAATAGTITGGSAVRGATATRPRRISILTGGATTVASNQTVTIFIKGFQDLR